MAKSNGKEPAAERPLATDGKTGKYRREKPWDTPDIDKWQNVTLSEDQSTGPFLEESSFATLFPKYREKYLKEMWSAVTKALKAHHIDCVLDLLEGSMTVKTSRKTFDPYIIIKARDFIKLLARSVPFQHAVRILDDEVACDIIKIGGLVRNKEKLVKRRQRLLGPNGATLKALELLTECYVLVQGNTVSTIGSFKGLKQVRKCVIDCMNNVHPIYFVKEMMIKRELSQNAELKDESWDRFLPKFKKQNAPKQKKPKFKKKEYTPFPPEQTPSKVDLELMSGEYHLMAEQKKAIAQAKKKEQQQEVTKMRAEEKEKLFVAPKEKPAKKTTSTSGDNSVDVAGLKTKLKRNAADQAAGNAKRAKKKADPDGGDGFILKKKKKKVV